MTAIIFLFWFFFFFLVFVLVYFCYLRFRQDYYYSNVIFLLSRRDLMSNYECGVDFVGGWFGQQGFVSGSLLVNS